MVHLAPARPGRATGWTGPGGSGSLRRRRQSRTRSTGRAHRSGGSL